MIRLIATDLDGTLVAPDGRISALDHEALQAAAEAGVTVVVATGRPLRWLGVLDAVRAAHPLVIVSNGAGLYDLGQRRLLAARYLDVDVVAEVMDAVRAAVPGVAFALERGDRFGCEDGPLARFLRDPDTLVAPTDQLLAELGGVLKLMVCHGEASSSELAALVAAAVGPRVEVTWSMADGRFALVELAAPGVSKESALATLCDELGVAASDVVAFGDMPNDEGMLAWAGRGFVMANGDARLRGRFEVVGSNADSGVGRRILQLLGEVPDASPPGTASLPA